MSHHDGGHGTTLLVGLALGATVGLVLGFLYAPKPGRETRRILKEKANKVCDRIRESHATEGTEGA